MLIRRTADIKPSEITPESIYLRRRELMAAATLGLAGWMAPGWAGDAPQSQAALRRLSFAAVDEAGRERGFDTAESRTPYEDVTHYNNFYEFGTGKTDPARYAGDMQTRPWHVVVEGEVGKPGRYALEDLLGRVDLEERVYRLRCVEAWSMVIPWVGFPLAALLNRLEPTSRAKYVAFETLHEPRQMRGQRSRTSFIDWPYVEGLRIDEAMHPLTLLAVGLYGRELPNQNGAPLRLVVPWKYGFKSIKSIVRIHLRESRPPTSWNLAAPREYGFYANVNPEVDHPRWSQKHERRLPSGLFSPNRIDTRLFNGYEQQVAGLYRGLDLRRNF